MDETSILLLLRQHGIKNVKVVSASRLQEQQLSDIRDAFVIVDESLEFACSDNTASSIVYNTWHPTHRLQCRQCSVAILHPSGHTVAAYCASRNVFLVVDSVDYDTAFMLYTLTRMMASGRVEYASMLMDPWRSVASLVTQFAKRIEMSIVNIDTRVCRQHDVDVVIDDDGIVLFVEASGTTRYVTIGGKLYELVNEEIEYWFSVRVRYTLNGDVESVYGRGYLRCCGEEYPHPNIDQDDDDDSIGRVCLGSYKPPALNTRSEVCAQLAKVRDDIVRVLSRPELFDAYNRLYDVVERVEMREVGEWRG